MLSGTIVLEDSIMQKGEPAAAGSKILDNFISPFDATVVASIVERLGAEKISGRVSMDEFGINNMTETLSEAVKVVKDGMAGYCLCNDIFGKYRQQAAENGCCYIRPAYGTVSRYGLIPMVSSMDQIGIVCKNLSDGFKLLSYIAGNDINDGAMFPEQKYDYTKANKNITIGIPDFAAHQAIQDFSGNFKTVKIKLGYFDVYKQVMCILSSAEISGNISRYDGIKFGYRASGYKGLNDLYIKTRTEGFGLETKLVAIMGAMVLTQDNYTKYYEKAMKVRRLIKESLRFDEYDVIALPCKISENPYENLSLYSLANLAGLPSVSFTYKGHGIQLISNVKNESLLLTAQEVGLS